MGNFVPLVVLTDENEIKTQIWLFKKKENAQDIISKLLQRKHIIITMPLDITFWLIQLARNLGTRGVKSKAKQISCSRS
ncbi:hypothetical protein MWU76_15670 [Gelidibacter sp. F2691]|nr:hypothetical protein [Gelidibacter sp. F2691]